MQSQGWARLLVGRCVAPGEALRAFLHNEGHRVYCICQARVVYTFPAPGGAYVLGLAFHWGLSAAEVEGLKGLTPWPVVHTCRETNAPRGRLGFIKNG